VPSLGIVRHVAVQSILTQVVLFGIIKL
jgi:hypothetical protein